MGIAFWASWEIAFVVLGCFPIVIVASTLQMQNFAQAGREEVEDENADAAAAAAAIALKADASKKASQKESGKTLEDAENGKTEDNALVAKPAGASGVVSGGHGAVISAAFTHMRTVCAFSMQHTVADHYIQITRQKALDRASKGWIIGLSFGIGQGAVLFIYALLFWYAVLKCIKLLSFSYILISEQKIASVHLYLIYIFLH